MNRIAIYLSVFVALCLTLVSCDTKLDADSQLVSVAVRIEYPEDIDPACISDDALSFTNISTGEITRFPSDARPSVMPGLYDISFEAVVTLENGVKSRLSAMTQSVKILAENTLVTLKAYNNIATDDLIIREIFFTGTLQTSGNGYIGDSYIKIYNNTDHVIYADGLTFFESKFLTTQKLETTPDIMNECMTVDALYTIPGNGTEHPVEPGQTVLIADIGIDHSKINPNSFDLSHADWEWYDESSSPSTSDIDSPLVPNLDKWYCYTKTIFMLHNQGFKAYGLARIPVGKEKYVADYYYDYDYISVTSAGSFAMSGSAYKLPNEWIVDLVTCSSVSNYQWNISTPAIDMGWTWCAEMSGDKTRYFRSVRRKLLYVTDDGRAVLRDTNNSTADFNSKCIPSEIELQGTPTGVDEPCATTITYDGVTPVKQ